MKQLSKRWLAVISIFALVNVGGAVYAAAMGEGMHAGLHVSLLLLGSAAFAVWRLGKGSNTEESQPAGAVGDTIERIQNSVDAIAIEVERIGEAQRFNDKIIAERAREV